MQIFRHKNYQEIEQKWRNLLICSISTKMKKMQNNERNVRGQAMPRVLLMR